MRLIRTANPIKLGEFRENEVANLKYAILSHRWEEEGEEVSFQEMVDYTDKSRHRQKKGYRKILRFCERARNDGFEYVWVDTCCINKESSAELSEAINSMFRWYLESARCYAYISDVSSRDQLADSVWFTRGWTLQELVAPREMFFLDKTWSLIGSRNELCSELENITKIDTSLLLGKSRLDQFSIAKRMSWAATRETTRTEDRAYSLLGLFDVNMPLLYGEGNNAFTRLQEEIMRNSNDETLFAWESEDVSTENPSGVFARSPRDFANAGDIFPISLSSDATPCTATNRGIRIQSPLLPPHSEATTLVLQCSSGDGVIGIGLMSKPGTNNNEDFIRVTGCLQRQVQFDLLFGAVLDTVYIPKTFVGTPMSTKVTCSPSRSDDLSRERDLLRTKRRPLSTIRPRGHNKMIIIALDETDTYGSAKSNVGRIHQMLKRNENEQVCFYRGWTLMTTLKQVVLEGYKFLIEHFQRGDTISFFAFSKGAYAATTLSSLIHLMGILVPGNDSWIPEVWRKFCHIYFSKRQRKRDLRSLATPENPFPVVLVEGRNHFFGIFDPRYPLSSKRKYVFMEENLYTQVVRYALSIDELHALPDIYDRYSTPGLDIQDKQHVWFPGSHQGVGGALDGESRLNWHLSHSPLGWMVNEARKAGMTFDPIIQTRYQCGGIPFEIKLLNNGRMRNEHCEIDDDYLNHPLSSAEHGFVRDESELYVGCFSGHGCRKKAREWISSKILGYSRKSSMEGNHRYIRPGALIHHSALHRMKVDSMYRPPNVRISEASKVVNRGNPFAEYIIQGDDNE